MEVGRNDPCPCGSGLKYKKCCQGKQQTWSVGAVLVLVVLGLVFIVGGYALWVNLTSPDAPRAVQRQRVWSQEHGHYHD